MQDNGQPHQERVVRSRDIMRSLAATVGFTVSLFGPYFGDKIVHKIANEGVERGDSSIIARGWEVSFYTAKYGLIGYGLYNIAERLMGN